MKMRSLSQSCHPFDSYPFEIFYQGSWRTVERLRVNSGAISLHLLDLGYIFEGKGLMSSLRIRPRRATQSDCTCLLRPGVDICILSPCQPSQSSRDTTKPVWVEARISSVQRKPHGLECNCIFYVKVLTVEDYSGSLRGTQSKEITKLGIDQITILQQLPQRPNNGNTQNRWRFAENCTSMRKTKLLLGTFLSDVSWMVAASVHKQITFDIRSVENKIVYQILDDTDNNNYSSDLNSRAVNFKCEGDLLVPVVVPFVPVDLLERSAAEEENEEMPEPSYELLEVRRSKRRNVKPDRYLGDIGLEEADITSLRIGWKSHKMDEDEEDNNRGGQELPSLLLTNEANNETLKEGGYAQSVQYEMCPGDMIHARVKNYKPKQVKSGSCNQRKKRFQESTTYSCREPNKKVHFSTEKSKNGGKDEGQSDKKSRLNKKRKSQPHCPAPTTPRSITQSMSLSQNLALIPPRHRTTSPRSNIQSRKGSHSKLALAPLQNESCRISSGQKHLQEEMKAEEMQDDVPLKYYRRRKRATGVANSKKLSELDCPENAFGWVGKTSSAPQENYWDKRASSSGIHKCRGRLHRPIISSFPRRDSYFEPSSNASGKNKNLDAGAYKELISAYMKNVQLTIENKLPQCKDPLKQLMGEKDEIEEEEPEEEQQKDEEEEEDLELEMLWKEMELCLASLYLEGKEEENEEADELHKSCEVEGRTCQHVFKLDDEIGLICSLCSHVATEIRNIIPEFYRSTGCAPKHEKSEKDDLEHKLIDEVGVDFVTRPSSLETPLSEMEDNVWALVPHMREKLHPHQKKAFEFLWRNIGGSLVPSKMESKKKKIGGCVISHSPGAGKTFLIIAFLVSYLKLFPGKRPLVLAPKTTLYTWYKEIIKWEFPVPVYQIHGRKTYRERIYSKKMERGSTSLSSNIVPSGDVMHVLDCLEKLQKWHAHPSVLLMGYTSFMTLMREDAKYEYRRYMGQILRESPGILILDEGHNPRSTKSRMRKALMRIGTDLRILLSGTLFQNNFGEYFNTLCLARPKFVDDALKVLDPKYKKKIKGMQKTRTSVENRARKVFMDIIASKIDSGNPEEQLDGRNQLKKMTKKFINFYEAGAFENLPGLQSYTLLMKPTAMQHEILVKLHKFMNVARGYPLELELMITLGSIHPWLTRTAVCANKFMSMDELSSLEEHRLDPAKGSKVKFVLMLVHRCIVREEKVLIFCHNIAPINMFQELFERIYGWEKGREVMVLTGDLELFERGRVMDRFEERGGPSKVMLASINACAEGISLTAASRVILLDSEWNPSKQKQAIARAFRPGQEKVVHVYQLLTHGTLEEEKYKRTTWKEWVSCMIFSEELVEDPSRWQAEKIEDELLREIVEEDHAMLFHMIMKNEKTSYANPINKVNG